MTSDAPYSPVPDLTQYVALDEKACCMANIKLGTLQHPQLGTFKVAIEVPHRASEWEKKRTERLPTLPQDVELLRRLEHPNLNPLIGFCTLPIREVNETCTIFRWIPKGSVSECIKDGVPFQVFKVLVGVARALDYLHKQGQVYRQLKGSNILINTDGEPLIRHMSLWLLHQRDSDCIVHGLPWAPPEAISSGAAGPKADVYAFGMVIAEILTRNSPFHKIRSNMKMTLAILKGERPSTDDVVMNIAPLYWRKLWDVASRCWKGDPTARPTMEEVILDLNKLADIPNLVLPDITNSVVECEGKIAQGGFCAVHRGKHKTIGEVALRCPLERREKDDQQRFWREMAIWFKLDHPNINPLVGVYWSGNKYYVASPWMKNGSIWSCIKGNVEFDALTVLIGVAEAVSYLHDNNVVHGDLKLDNVLLTSSGEAKLTDFGLAKCLDPAFPTSVGTRGAGSVPWQAPEILLGGQRSKSSDVWAFGMMVVELLIRNTPFWAPAMIQAAVIYRIINGQNQPSREEVNLQYAPSCWPQLWDVATECRHPDPPTRPAIGSIVDRLKAIQRSPEETISECSLREFQS